MSLAVPPLGLRSCIQCFVYKDLRFISMNGAEEQSYVSHICLRSPPPPAPPTTAGQSEFSLWGGCRAHTTYRSPILSSLLLLLLLLHALLYAHTQQQLPYTLHLCLNNLLYFESTTKHSVSDKFPPLLSTEHSVLHVKLGFVKSQVQFAIEFVGAFPSVPLHFLLLPLASQELQ